MMTFYAAAGSYQIRSEDGKNMPYIMRLGKLQPVSIPEFSLWSMLLWDVLTYEELHKKFYDKMEETEIEPSSLVLQTPLSVPELVRCFENNVHDVSSADKVISAIYTEESDNQARLNNASSLSDYRHDVLEATANLYLTRQVILEHA